MSGHKLLLADDSVTIQKVVQLTFIDEGIDVTSAGDGDAAFLRFLETDPDIVLADVHMPGLDGYELCRRIKDSENPVPVVLLVGTFEPFDSDKAHEAGADAFLTKPFQSIRQLVDVVSNLLTENGASAATAASTSPVGDEDDEQFIETREIPREETDQLGDSGMDDEMIETTPAASLFVQPEADTTPGADTAPEPDAGQGYEIPQPFAAAAVEEEYRPDLADTRELVMPGATGSDIETAPEFGSAVQSQPEFEPAPEASPETEPEYEINDVPVTASPDQYGEFQGAPVVETPDESAHRYSGFEIVSDPPVQASTETVPEAPSFETRPRFELVPDPPVGSVADDSNLLEIPGRYGDVREAPPAPAPATTSEASAPVSAEFVEAVTQRVMEKMNDDFFKDLIREIVPQVVREFAEEKMTE